MKNDIQRGVFFMKTISTKTKICFLFTMLWCGFIFFFSAQDGTASNHVSDTVVMLVSQIFLPVSAVDNSDGDSLSLVLLVRKAAHFSIYFVLGILSTLTTTSHFSLKKKAWAVAWSFCIFYAFTDELHQYFVADRSSRLLDVGIDSMGALLGSSICFWILRRHQSKVSGASISVA